MAELTIDRIPCYIQDTIQGEVITAVPEGFPFSQDFLDTITDKAPVVVGITGSNNDPAMNLTTNDKGEIQLRSLSPNHGRSFEVFVGDPSKSETALGLWSDEFGNHFTSLSLKGNNFSNNYILESLSAPSGYMPFGLQETDSLLRVVRASRLLREVGVDTEMIVRMIEPQYFVWSNRDAQKPGIEPVEDRELVTLPEMKRRLLLDYAQVVSGESDAMVRFQKVTEAIGEMSFFITLRATGIGTRMDDLICGPKECRKQLKKTFFILNMQPDKYMLDRDNPLDSDNFEHVEYYYTGLLPRLIGRNIALIQKKGLVHSFTSTGNTTLLGGIVDLDGVRGSTLDLGDEEPTIEEYVDDITYFDDHSRPGNYFQLITMHLLNAFEEPITTLKISSWEITFMANLIDSYFSHLFPDQLAVMSPDEITQAVEIGQDVYDRTGFFMHKRHLGGYLDELFTSVDDLPCVPDEEVLNAVADMQTWVRAELDQNVTQMLLNAVNERTHLELSQESIFEQIKSTVFKNIIEMLDIDIHESLHNLLARADIRALIDEWIGQKIASEECILPSHVTEAHVRSIVTHILYEKIHQSDAVHSITLRALERLEQKFEKFELHTTTVLKDPDEHIEQAVKVMLDGQLHVWYTPLDKDVFLESLRDSGNEGIRVSIKVEKRPKINIRTAGKQVIREIYTDILVDDIQILVQQAQDSSANTTADIHSRESMNEYMAWLVENIETGQQTLQIRVANRQLKKHFKSKLAEKSFNKQFQAVVEQITEKYMGSMAILESLNETHEDW